MTIDWIEIKDWIKENIINVLVSTGMSGLIVFWFKGFITNRFQKSLEQSKSDLSKEIESIKFNQSMMFKEFELFATKKHEHYPELYKRIELCIGKVMSLRGIVRVLSFENVGKEDVEEYMKEKLFTKQDTTQILELWETRKEEAIQKLNNRLENIKYNEAREEYGIAWDYLLLNRFFFSEELEEISNELLKNIHKLWVNYDPIYRNIDATSMGELIAENEELKKNIDKLRKGLEITMRRELTNVEKK